MLAVAGLADASPRRPAHAPGSPPSSLHARAVAALPAARKAFDSTLTDYPSARFQDVHARIVHSVYDDDEGQSNKVPWAHRGGLVLVICGEVNAKNRMGGYTGWTAFAFEPAQTDMVSMYGYEAPTRLSHTFNLASRDELTTVHGDRVDDEDVGLLCGGDPPPQATDQADLSAELSANPRREAGR
ncbi:MAG TPA: hypothetical protein VHW60_16055 [Caulobacteraceae bacterium]|nr:hypothetical protein [Caulobacteraceae bacterium]